MRDFAFTMYKALVAAPDAPVVDKKEHKSKDSKDSDDKKEDKDSEVSLGSMEWGVLCVELGQMVSI